MEQERDWASRLANEVGRRVAYYRERAEIRQGRRISAQALADRCAELGHPLDRSVIAKLEKGHRQTVTLADIIVLARALDVPPLQLAYPVLGDESVEVLPGHQATPGDAALWFAGEAPFPLDGDSRQWEEGAAPLMLLRRHRRLVDEWDQVIAMARRWRELGVAETVLLDGAGGRSAAASAAQAVEEQLRRIESDIRQVRREIQRRGLTLPAVPDGLRHVDERHLEVLTREQAQNLVGGNVSPVDDQKGAAE